MFACIGRWQRSGLKQKTWCKKNDIKRITPSLLVLLGNAKRTSHTMMSDMGAPEKNTAELKQCKVEVSVEYL